MRKRKLKNQKNEEHKPKAKKSIEKTLAFQPNGANWNWLFKKEKKNADN